MATITATSGTVRLTRNMILAAEARLGQVPGLDTVFCTYHDGILTLSGHVATAQLRRLACVIAKALDGVHEVENEVVVTPSWVDMPQAAGPGAFSVASGPAAFAH
jgi:osmotically-inducible protein OsmY